MYVFLKIDTLVYTPNCNLLAKVGKIQLRLIKNTCFSSLLLQMKPVIIKTISNFRIHYLLNFQKKKS